jgi:predicted enzyme related to lactoylglutathione lyase
VLLILSPRRSDERRRAAKDELPDSDVFFVCDDIKRTHQELTARGVRFHTPPIEMPFGWWAMFEDTDGTRYALTQEA